MHKRHLMVFAFVLVILLLVIAFFRLAGGENTAGQAIGVFAETSDSLDITSDGDVGSFVVDEEGSSVVKNTKEVSSEEESTSTKVSLEKESEDVEGPEDTVELSNDVDSPVQARDSFDLVQEEDVSSSFVEEEESFVDKDTEKIVSDDGTASPKAFLKVDPNDLDGDGLSNDVDACPESVSRFFGRELINDRGCYDVDLNEDGCFSEVEFTIALAAIDHSCSHVNPLYDLASRSGLSGDSCVDLVDKSVFVSLYEGGCT